VNGKPLSEAAVCTLEVVLRNTASYSIGFLLIPKYKRHQEECISKASSWIVLAYFPFPKGPAGSIRKVECCETNQEKVKALLLDNMPQRSDSGRVSAREGDSKPSLSCVSAVKRTSNNPIESQKKRRNFVPLVAENDKAVFPMQYIVAPPPPPVPKTESVVSYTLESGSGFCEPKCLSKEVSSTSLDPYYWSRQQSFMWNTQDGNIYPLLPQPSCSEFPSFSCSAPQPAQSTCEPMVKMEKDEKEEDGYVLADSWNYYEDGAVFPFGEADACSAPKMMGDGKEGEPYTLPMMWSSPDDAVFSSMDSPSSSSSDSSPMAFQGSDETDTVAESVVQQPSPIVVYPGEPSEMRDLKDQEESCVLPFGEGSNNFWRCGSSSVFSQPFMADSGCPVGTATTPTPVAPDLFPRSDSTSLNQTGMFPLYHPEYVPALFGLNKEE